MKNIPSVVSGHQSMFLGGPLFVLNKILGILHIGKKENLQPLFWLETNDADFQEISWAGLIDKENHYQRIKISRKKIKMPNGFRIGDIPINDDILQKIEEFFTLLPTTKHTQTLKNMVLQTYGSAKNLGDANLVFFKKLLSKGNWSKNIIFFDPREQKFIDFCKPFFLREAILTKDDHQCPFFAFINQSRQAIFKKENQFFTRIGKKIDLENTTLLPSLLTRNILQDAFLNVKIYLAGPNESIYLKKLEKRYKIHNIEKSSIHKRMSTIILKQKDEKNLVDLTEILQKKAIFYNEENLLDCFLQMEKQQIFSHFLFLCTKFDEKNYKNFLKQIKDEFINQLHQNDADKNMVKAMEKKIYCQQKHILGAKRKTKKKEMKEIFPLLDNLLTQIKPVNGQERDLSLLYFLNHFGVELLEQLENFYTHEQKIFYESKMEIWKK